MLPGVVRLRHPDLERDSRSLGNSHMTPHHVLAISGLTKSFGDLVAVSDLSLEVVRGEILGLLGPNGAGKTTTVNLVCGLLGREAGEIRVNGQVVAANDRMWRRSLGLCPQELVIWEGLTCLEQLQFVGSLYDLSRHRARQRALELLGALGLTDRRDSLAKTLSGGMKRRLNIALALVHGPDLLILDEPQAGLDPQSRILVREYIRSLSDHTTVVLTTHDMDEADRLSDRIAIMDHGQLLVLDTPEMLKDEAAEGDILEIELRDASWEQIDRVRQSLPVGTRLLASDGDVLRLAGTDILNRMPTLLQVLRDQRIDVGQMLMRKRTLEDVFITLTGRGLRE
jgi:ABC-2 type transport system ATP-binding protein